MSNPESGNLEPNVSVVVASRDRATRLAALLESLRNQTLDTSQFEVIIVDDGSRDGTADLLARERARGALAFRVVSRSRAEGPAAARNDGWRTASAAIVAFTDDDCEVSPEWLEEGLRACGADPGSFVQGRTEPLPSELERGGPFSRTLKIDAPGPFFQTCNMFYPRELLERLGGFDTAFTAPGGEDTDLAWRAMAAGATPRYAPRALVHHAVENLGPVGLLRVALRWADAMQALGRHPGLREEVLVYGLFWKRSHALLLLALAGAALARRRRAGAALALPYARHLAWRCHTAGASPALAPYFVLHDSLEVLTTLRGAARHRVAVL